MEVQTKKQLRVELFQVEMPTNGDNSCTACDTVQVKLVSAIQEVQKLFDKIGCEILFKHTTVKSLEEAEKFNINASPTIRVGHFDFYPNHVSECSEAREWFWDDETLAEPNEVILIQVLLKGYFSKTENTERKKLSPYILKHLTDKEIQKTNCGCK
ncbi:MAG: DUF2703 domain-containing protein [Flammeovirgaceae bacterium]|nr:MAG: DUF2703 domain-containing protein [Flammeovirgaceae bacterium]